MGCGEGGGSESLNIFLWDGNNTSQISVGGNAIHHSLFDGTIAWMHAAGGSGFDIEYRDGMSTTTIGTGNGPISNWAENVAWHFFPNPNVGTSFVQLWDAGSGLTTEIGLGAIPRVWNGQVAFGTGGGGTGIDLWDGNEITHITDISPRFPISFQGGQMAFADDNLNMYFWDGSSVIPLGIQGVAPQVWNGQLAWGGTDSNIYFADDIASVLSSVPPIPAPGSTLLAVLGLPMVAWVKRRYAKR